LRDFSIFLHSTIKIKSKSNKFHGKPVLPAIDPAWGKAKGANFNLIPENGTEARVFIAEFVHCVRGIFGENM
jgi:hypothetical protein